MSETTFTSVCEILEKIQETKPMPRKEELFREFLSKSKVSLSSMYPVIRLIIPSLDNERPKSGLHVNTIGKIYVKTLQLGKTSPDAIKFTQKQSIKTFTKNVLKIMKVRSTVKSKTCTLIEINQILDKFFKSSRKDVELEFVRSVNSLMPLEQKWMLNILLKKLDLGLSVEKLLSIYHPSASQLYNRNTDLKFVCDQIDSGKCTSTTLCGATLFRFLKPMLCLRIDSKKVNEILSTIDQFIVEEKMDGERFQIHYESWNGNIKYLSRMGIDYTHKFDANLTAQLCRSFDSSTKNCILDGEMMVWDQADQKYKVKGEFVDVKNLGSTGNDRPCFVCFDILYFNNKSLIDSPYSERLDILKRSFQNSIGIFHVIINTKITSLSSFTEYFNKSLDSKSEGVVLKKCSSTYKPGMRMIDWVKIKPDYIDGLISDLDVLVLGVNIRFNSIESFYVGVIDSDEIFHCIGKVSSGLSEAKRKVLSNDLRPHLLKTQPPNVKFGDEKPYFFVNVEKSVILQIRASELVASSSFATISTVRFPRIDSIRNDKVWKECMKLSEYEDLYRSVSSVTKIHKRKTDESDFSGRTSKRTMRTVNPYKVELEPISEVLSEKFLNQNFCILSSSKPYSIHQAKEMVLKLSGKIMENPSPKINCICIAGDTTPKVKNILASQKYNIISLDWLVRQFQSPESNLKFLPKDLIFATKELNDQLRLHFDDFGDSYDTNVTPEELKEILDDMKVSDEDISNEDIQYLETKMFKGKSTNIFRKFRGMFPKNDDSWYNYSENIFKFYGGEVLEMFTPGKTKTLLFAERMCNFYHPDVLLINFKWILDSHKSKKVLDLENYIIK